MRVFRGSQEVESGVIRFSSPCTVNGAGRYIIAPPDHIFYSRKPPLKKYKFHNRKKSRQPFHATLEAAQGNIKITLITPPGVCVNFKKPPLKNFFFRKLKFRNSYFVELQLNFLKPFTDLFYLIGFKSYGLLKS